MIILAYTFQSSCRKLWKKIGFELIKPVWHELSEVITLKLDYFWVERNIEGAGIQMGHLICGDDGLEKSFHSACVWESASEFHWSCWVMQGSLNESLWKVRENLSIKWSNLAKILPSTSKLTEHPKILVYFVSTLRFWAMKSSGKSRKTVIPLILTNPLHNFWKYWFAIKILSALLLSLSFVNMLLW